MVDCCDGATGRFVSGGEIIEIGEVKGSVVQKTLSMTRLCAFNNQVPK
ncbi:MAG: mechanosensitive ion channel domain-containing protein [Thermosynechococcus sp.]